MLWLTDPQIHHPPSTGLNLFVVVRVPDGKRFQMQVDAASCAIGFAALCFIGGGHVATGTSYWDVCQAAGKLVVSGLAVCLNGTSFMVIESKARHTMCFGEYSPLQTRQRVRVEKKVSRSL